MDIRDICDPFAVRSFCVEIPIQQIFISVNLLSKLLLLPASADFRQQTVGFHNPENRFGIPGTTVFVQPKMHPAMAVCILATFLLTCNLVYDCLVWIWMVQLMNVSVIPTPGNTKEFAHPPNRILFPITVNHGIFRLCSHFLPVDRRKSRSSSFSIFSRSISAL